MTNESKEKSIVTIPLLEYENFIEIEKELKHLKEGGWVMNFKYYSDERYMIVERSFISKSEALEGVKEQLDRYKSEIQQIKKDSLTERTALKSRLDQKQREIESLKDIRTSISKQRDSLQDRIEQLKEMIPESKKKTTGFLSLFTSEDKKGKLSITS